MPKKMPNRKKSSLGEIFFFFGVVVISCLIVIFYISLKNECLTAQGEIYHLSNIHHTHSSRVIMLESDMRSLMRRDFIEAAARSRIGMTFPAPESLVVFMGAEG
jgi:cell division protein FtsL